MYISLESLMYNHYENHHAAEEIRHLDETTRRKDEDDEKDAAQGV